eukprot:4384063-Prymnesium_polylepis.1
MALHTNATIGGLLNATFGNVTEMIVSLFAIKSGLLRVVQLSLLGSVLSNLLLVLGCSFLLGGFRYKEQHFSADTVRANTSLLMLGMITLLLPAMLDITNTQLHDDDSLTLSRICSLILLIVYVGFLVFQLKTHTYLFEGTPKPEPPPADGTPKRAPPAGDDDDDDDEEEEVLGFWGASAPPRRLSTLWEPCGDPLGTLWLARATAACLGHRGHRGVVAPKRPRATRPWDPSLRDQSPAAPPFTEPQSPRRLHTPSLALSRRPAAVFWMGVITLFISLLSEYIVDTIEGAAKALKIPV